MSRNCNSELLAVCHYKRTSAYYYFLVDDKKRSTLYCPHQADVTIMGKTYQRETGLKKTTDPFIVTRQFLSHNYTVVDFFEWFHWKKNN